MPRSYFIHTFGCQMNVHDSGKIASILSRIGYSSAESDSSADLILFNTCTVREHAHHKAISQIGRAVLMKNRKPDLIVCVCGCVAQEERDNLFQKYPELDIVFGPDQIYRLPELLKETMDNRSKTADRKHRGGSCATELIDDPDEYNWKYLLDAGPIANNESPITAFVTIMKGCNNKCTFCIVPHVRGGEVSRPVDDIIAETSALVKRGVKEVTLLGQNVNSYCARPHCPSLSNGKGKSEGGSDFVRLVQRISAETGILRIRYTSPHPKDLLDDLIDEHASNPKLCRHMHLPLQAGSSRILKMMKRTYNRKQFVEKALRLRERAKGIDITTDVIVGFPSETEAEFCETLDVVREVAFDGMFAFKYSPRPGTRAAGLKDDIPREEKEERLARLLELNAKLWREKTQRLVGTVQDVLVEGASRKHILSFERSREDKMSSSSRPANARSKNNDMQLSGRTFANKIVNFAGNFEMVGHIVPVEITFAGPNSLRGEIKS